MIVVRNSVICQVQCY